MKTMISIMTPDIESNCQEFYNNHIEYAASNGYTYQCMKELPWTEIPASHSKIWGIMKALENNDNTYVLYADMDVAFMDMTFDLASLVGSDQWMAGYDQQNKQWIGNRPYICAGLMIIKNCDQAKNFFKIIFEKIDIMNADPERKSYRFFFHPWEQWSVDELMVSTKFAGVNKCNVKQIGGFCSEMWHDGYPWTPGCPTIHITGNPDWSIRSKVFTDIYKSQIKRKG